MTADEGMKPRSLKEPALEELKVYWVITLYLWLFLGCLIWLRLASPTCTTASRWSRRW
jgi:hypothetical protein